MRRTWMALVAVAVLAGSWLKAQDDSTWQRLRQSADNTRRSLLIQELKNAQDQEPLVARLQTERDPSVKRALILALRDPEPLRPLLLRWYRDDPDPGIHAAIRFALRGTALLAEAERELAGNGGRDKDWYVTRQGQTMVRLTGPMEFTMGASASEEGRSPGPDSPPEPQYRVRIPRDFAIGSTEVTIAQFRRFLDANSAIRAGFAYPDNPGRMAEVLARFSPDDDGPQIALTWYEAAMYCNWLSKVEGLPESEWVYPAEIRSGMRLPPEYLRRTGYRLPTEAEWEYAARAGTTTPRYFGEGVELLPHYAWFSRNPPLRKGDPADPTDPQRAAPVAQKMPNDFGLFDMLGNVWEWTQDRMQTHPDPERTRIDREDTVREVRDDVSRSRRGGAFPYSAAFQRSANRDTVGALPNLRRDNVGFRIVRTLRAR